MASTEEQIAEYYKQKPNFVDLWQKYPPSSITTAKQTTTATNTTSSNNTMPVHPKEEEASGSIYDQVAKESSDSTASSHEIHQEDTGATSGGSAKATVQDHKATPGPVIAENLGEPASKEDLKKRAAELNK